MEWEGDHKETFIENDMQNECMRINDMLNYNIEAMQINSVL